MSKNHGRRLIIEGREARNLTRSELFDVIAEMVEHDPDVALNVFEIELRRRGRVSIRDNRLIGGGSLTVKEPRQ